MLWHDLLKGGRRPKIEAKPTGCFGGDVKPTATGAAVLFSVASLARQTHVVMTYCAVKKALFQLCLFFILFPCVCLFGK